MRHPLDLRTALHDFHVALDAALQAADRGEAAARRAAADVGTSLRTDPEHSADVHDAYRNLRRIGGDAYAALAGIAQTALRAVEDFCDAPTR